MRCEFLPTVLTFLSPSVELLVVERSGVRKRQQRREVNLVLLFGISGNDSGGDSVGFTYMFCF